MINEARNQFSVLYSEMPFASTIEIAGAVTELSPSSRACLAPEKFYSLARNLLVIFPVGKLRSI